MILLAPGPICFPPLLKIKSYLAYLEKPPTWEAFSFPAIFQRLDSCLHTSETNKKTFIAMKCP